MKYAIILIVLSAAALQASAVEMFVNPSFEKGTEGWSLRGETACIRAVKRGGFNGRSMLVFDTGKPGQYARIRQSVKNQWPGKALEITYRYKYVDAKKPNSPALLPGEYDYNKISTSTRFFEKVNGKLVAMETLETVGTVYFPFLVGTKRNKGWIERTERLNPPEKAVSLHWTLSVANFPGKVYLDYITVRAVEHYKRKPVDMWYYNPLQAKLGKPLKARANKLFADKSPFIEAADKYNGLLTKAALAVDNAKILMRAYCHAGETKNAQAPLAGILKLEKQLNRPYRTFQQLFFDNNSKDLDTKFYPDIKKLEGLITAEHDDIKKQLVLLQAKTGWTPRSERKPKPYAITPGGAPNQITFGKLSKATHHSLERHMGLNRLLNPNHFNGLRRIGRKQINHLDWEGAAKNLVGSIKEYPITKHLGVGTIFAAHRGAPVSRGWFNAHKDEPDILLSGVLGRASIRDTGCPLVNYWNPKVRKEVGNQAVSAGKALSKYKQVFFIAYAQEAGGPRVSTPKGRCMAGGGPNALADFHAYLEKQYGNIDKLNKRWKTGYKTFKEINLIPDGWQRKDSPKPNPLGYWQERWRMDSYMDWLKLIYDGFKKGAPDKPVMTSHNRLCTRIQPARVFESSDIVGYHAGSPEQWVNGKLLQSMRRYVGREKSMGQFETTWATQGWRSRPGNERVQRAGLICHAYNMAMTDMHVQHFWYAYTGQAYMLYYNGNWFNPSTDVLTYRYSAGGMRVAVNNLEKLSDVFVSTRKLRSRILMIHPTTVAYHQWSTPGSRHDEKAVWRMLNGANIDFEFLPEEFIEDGRVKPADYDVIILPFAPYMKKALAARLVSWTAKGGMLISLGPCAVYDELGFPTPTAMKKLFGFVPKARGNLVAAPGKWKGEKTDKDFTCESRVEKGRALYVKHPLSHAVYTTKGACQKRLTEAILKRTKPFVSCTNNRLRLQVRENSRGDKFLMVLNPNPFEIYKGAINLNAAFSSIVDISIPGGFPVPLETKGGKARFNVTVAPAQLAAFELITGKRE